VSFAVSGISTGLDTAAFVDAIMFAERATVRRLESSRASEDAALQAWTDIETRLNTLETAGDAIRDNGALLATTATSSDDSVVRVTVESTAVVGNYTLEVNSLAAAEQVSSVGLASGADLAGAGVATVSGGFGDLGLAVGSQTLTGAAYTLNVISIDTGASQATVTFNGVEQTVAVAGDGSFTVTAADGGTLSVTALSGQTLTTGSAAIVVIEADATTSVNNVASALNAAGSPVRAQVIDTGDGSTTSYRLLITSTSTGLDGAADIDLSALSAFSGGLTTLRAAADASVSIGGGALEISRSSNTITDLFDGLSIDLVGLSSGETVEILVSADLDTRLGAVTAVAQAVSDVLAQLSAYGSYDVEANRGGPLVGNFSVRSVQRELNEAMATVVSSAGFSLLSQIGITIDRTGTYAIDEVVLREALSSDSAAVQQVLLGDLTLTDDGVFDVVTNTVEGLLADAGRISTAQQAAEANIEALKRQIENQEVRLVNVEDRYRRQFTVLETLVGQLQSQSGFLAAMLGQ